MNQRRPWIMGNWKMNGTLSQAKQFFETFIAHPEFHAVDISLGIPNVYLKSVSEGLSTSQQGHIFLSAEDVSEHESGAYTGEVSAKMLKEAGASAVIIGHSERRYYHAETSIQIAGKVKMAVEAGLIPVLCVGETLELRQAGRTESILQEQLQSVLAITGLSVLEKLVLAYEPVWAIGTGLAATPDQIQAVHAFLRQTLRQSAGESLADQIRIVYGGSLKFSNAEVILNLEEVDGGLIGGASLHLDEFLSIIRLALTLKSESSL